MLRNAKEHAIQAARVGVARDVLIAMRFQEEAAGPTEVSTPAKIRRRSPMRLKAPLFSG